MRPVWTLFLAGIAVSMPLLLSPVLSAAGEDPRQLLAKSCPSPTTDGLCARPGRATSSGKISRCGDGTVWPMRRIRRDKRKARRALAMLKAAGSAEAELHLIDADLERYLDVRFPVGLDFSDENPARLSASKKRFAGFLQQKGNALAALRGRYVALGTAQGEAMKVAASLRVAQLFFNFAMEVFSAPIPRPPIPAALPKDHVPEFVAMFNRTYCETLFDKATPLLAKAGESAAFCLKKAGEADAPWGQACRELRVRVILGQAMAAAFKKERDKERKERRSRTRLLPAYYGPTLGLPARAPASDGEEVCRFRSHRWGAGSWDDAPKQGRGVGFVQLDVQSALKAEMTLTTDRPGEARIKLEGAGVVLHGQLPGGRFLYPTRPMALNSVVYNRPWTTMGWAGGEPGRLKVKLPTPDKEIGAVKPSAIAEVPCKVMSLEYPGYHAFEHALGSNKDMPTIWVHLKEALPVSATPGGVRLAHLPPAVKEPVKLTILERKGKHRKVLHTHGNTHVVGWVVATALRQRIERDPVGGMIGRPDPPPVVTNGVCQHDVALFARVGGRTARVGTVKKKTPIAVTGSVDGKWLTINLPTVRWFKPVKGASLMIELSARELCPGL
jgi:hypothetical protein